MKIIKNLTLASCIQEIEDFQQQWDVWDAPPAKTICEQRFMFHSTLWASWSFTLFCNVVSTQRLGAGLRVSYTYNPGLWHCLHLTSRMCLVCHYFASEPGENISILH
jgi:hypothetical protein